MQELIESGQFLTLSRRNSALFERSHQFTLANGTTGQIKILYTKTEASSGQTSVVTPANFANGTTLTFDAVGDAAVMYFNGTNWVLVAGNGVAVA